MSLNPAWRPELTELQLFEEKTWLQGGTLVSVTYGVVLTLFVLNFSILKDRISDSNSPERNRRSVALLAYVCVMFVLGTLIMASQTQMNQLGFIDNRNFPGGPGAFQREMFTIPVSNMGNFSFSLINWLADFLLMWRCTVIYQTCRYSLKTVMLFPVILYIATLVTGIVWLYEISRRASSYWGVQVLALVYSTLGLSFNILMTLMIVLRIIVYRRRIVEAVGPRHGSQYTSIIAILVESAFILDVVVLLFIIPFAIGNSLANAAPTTIAQVQIIASFLIIYRVATGTSWTSGTAGSLMTNGIHSGQELSAINFDKRAPQGSTSTDIRASDESTHSY